jgi:hypothetical protein
VKYDLQPKRHEKSTVINRNCLSLPISYYHKPVSKTVREATNRCSYKTFVLAMLLIREQSIKKLPISKKLPGNIYKMRVVRKYNLALIKFSWVITKWWHHSLLMETQQNSETLESAPNLRSWLPKRVLSLSVTMKALRIVRTLTVSFGRQRERKDSQKQKP